MYRWILVAPILAIGAGAAAPIAARAGEEKKADKAASALREAIKKADVVVVGKVSRVGLSAASSFDVGVIAVRETLKGKLTAKTVHFRFPSRGDATAAKYGKVGVDGVWVLSKEGAYLSARQVLSYQPLTELAAVRKLTARK